MKYGEHLPDEQLLLDVEGELSTHDQRLAKAHLAGCWKCRARRQELENAIHGFVRVYQREFEAKVRPAAGPRAMLKAQLEQLSSHGRSGFFFPHGFAWLVAACSLLVLGLLLMRPVQERRPHRQALILSVPDATLTPGATLLINRPVICAQENIKNKAVPVALQRRVFEEYGLAGADPRAYEVDYLVTPALGGAEDIHNLWPHSYSATAWNAQVKDALEDRLRDLVCEGQLDLKDAQKEIASNWITAYKKHFHTDRPLAEHCNHCVE